MGIEKIRSGYEGNSALKISQSNPVKNRVYLGEIKDSTSFTGAAAVAVNTTKPLQDILLEIMPKSASRMMKMHDGMGEIQNQLINAVGTGLIAPVFIKFNPLSDTDENTRTYTAWRQPVSAVLAVGTQCAIVKPFNDLIRWMADIGYLGERYNSSLFPSENYLTKLAKTQNPKLNKDELKTEVDNLKNKYAENLKSMIEDEKIVFTKTSAKGSSKYEMPEKDFKQLLAETIDTIIKDEEAQKLNTIDQKLPKKIERNIFYHNHPKEAIALLERVNSKITQSYSQADAMPEKPIDISHHIDKELKKVIAELKREMNSDPVKKDINPELIKIVKELKDKNIEKDTSSVRILSNKIESLIKNVNVMAAKGSTKEIIEDVNKTIFLRTNSIDDVIATLTDIKNRMLNSTLTVKEAQKIIDEKISKSDTHVWTTLRAQGLKDSDILNSDVLNESVGTRFKQKAGSLAKCIAEQMKNKAKANIDGYKRWTGLGVSLAILPVTCWMLNRIYPWFMDLAFPNLSNKQGKAQNDKKAEVK